MSKELTTLKYARENVNNSRLNVSRLSDNGEERGNRKMEERIRLKDRRIEELKETVLAYEEKVVELSRRETRNEEAQIYRDKLERSEKEHKL